MKPILRIKEKIEKLIDELNDELRADTDHIKDEMNELIHEFQCKLEAASALVVQPQVQPPISQRGRPDHNIIRNHDFSDSTNLKSCCKGFVASPESGYPEGISEKLKGDRFVVIRSWNKELPCLELDITNRVLPKTACTVCTELAISGCPPSVAALVTAFILVKNQIKSTRGFSMGRISATTEYWVALEDTHYFSDVGQVTFCLSGLPPGVNLLIKSLTVSCRNTQSRGYLLNDIIQNPKFESAHVLRDSSWSGRGCKILLRDSMGDPRVLPKSGEFFVSTENRTNECNGIQHDITGRVQKKLAYDVVAAVRIFGNKITTADVRATLWVQTADLSEHYIGIGSVQATNKDWMQLQGRFLLNCNSSRVVIYLDGPPPGTDILLDNLVVKHAAKAPPVLPPIVQTSLFGVNIIANSNLYDGTNWWSPLCNCTLRVKIGSPYILPLMAADSLGREEPLSGRYILVTNRTKNADGPAQIITAKVKPYVTYQVSAWVRTDDTSGTAPQIVNVGIEVDNEWISGGKVEINNDQWNEIAGSFRIEKEPMKVKVCVQGPDAGVDFMVAALQIFPVDRRARFRHLRKQTDRIRKRDVTLKFITSNASTLPGTMVKIRQTQNSFPFGSCVNMSDIDNEGFVDFFSKNFNWAIFPDELEWFRIDREKVNIKQKDAEKMLDFCTRHNIMLRGYCIFQFQSWINDFRGEYDGVLSRYKDIIMHYDVKNKEKGNLGSKSLAKIFKIANVIDPSATLFVNDHRVEDNKYVDHIIDLQKQGAPIGGIGIKGHVNSPIGPIVCDGLNKLARIGLPIWFTELDVSSDNEYVRADDIEVMLREAFAHNAVKGVMLCGFWELLMKRVNGHLVNAEGEINEAGKRYIALKQEWLSNANGHLDEKGRFEFRGFHGSYDVQVVTSSGKKVDKTFVIEEGLDPITITINI